MDFELGLKVTRNGDDEFSSANFQLLKDHGGPLFQSRETNSMFILTAHLRGYERGDIKISINEDGTIMVISGEKQVEETLMVGWRLHKKGIEIKKFRKDFRIPNGVVLDEIRADFNEDGVVLSISMPKRVKGIVGTLIEEIKEPKLENKLLGEESTKDNKVEGPSQVDMGSHGNTDQETKLQDEETEQERSMGAEQVEQTEAEFSSSGGSKQLQTDEEEEEDVLPKSDEAWEEKSDIHEEEEEEEEKKCRILCAPIIAGSALLLSFVVVVIQFIRSKNQPPKTN